MIGEGFILRSGYGRLADTVGRFRSAAVGVAVILAAGVLLSGPSHAQSLADSVATAVSGHPQVRGAEAGFRASQRAVEVEQGAFLPSVEVTADTGYQHATRGEDSEDEIDGDLWRKRYRGAVTQLLFDGFATSNRIDAADSRSLSALNELRDAANAVALRAIQAHLDVALNRELIEYARENVGLHQRIFGDVEEAARRGGGSNADVNQVQTRRAFAESQLRGLERDLLNAEADYREAIGMLPGTLERPQVPAAELPPSVEASLEIARRSNPQRRAAVEAARAAGYSADVQRGAFFPVVDLELAHEGRDGVSGEPDFETDSTALVRLRWNLFNGGADTASRRQALEEENQARLQVYGIDRQLEEAVEVAYNNYRIAGDQLALLRDRAATAQEVTIAYGEQFRLRQRTILDLLDSGNELFVARVDLARTEFEQLAAAYEILALTGTILPALGIEQAVADIDSVPEQEAVPARD